MRFELICPCGHIDLNDARIPIPPPGHSKNYEPITGIEPVTFLLRVRRSPY